MARVEVTKNLARHVAVSPGELPGATVRAVLEALFERNPELRGYVLDDQGALRKHVVVFVDGESIADRAGLSDAVGSSSELVVMQALSGGAP